MTSRLHRAICYLLIVTTFTSPAAVYAQAPADSRGKRRDTALKLIPEGSIVGVVAHPRRVLTDPSMQMLPIEVISAAGIKELGVDPLDIEMAVGAIDMPTGPPNAGLILQLAKPLKLEQLPVQLLAGTVEGKLGGKSYRQSREPMGLSAFMPSDRTLILGTDEALRKVVARSGAAEEGSVHGILSAGSPADLQLVAAIAPVSEMIKQQLQQTPPLPDGLEQLKSAPDLISFIELKLNFVDDQSGALTIHARSDAAAEELDAIVANALKTGKQMLLAQLGQEMQSDDPVEIAAQKYAARMTASTIEQLKPKREGNKLVFLADMENQATVATTSMLVLLLLPAVNAAREAARRTASTNNLRDIGFGIANHESATRRMPSDYYSEDGKPLLSWRVRILPYVEQGELYKQFRLDEPWDSEHNRKLIDKMPALFSNPNSSGTSKTHYLAVKGDGYFLSGVAGKGRSIREFKDGLSKTVAVVEADRPVIWTKPDDLEFDPLRPLNNLGNVRAGGIFLAVFTDVSVNTFSTTMRPDHLKAFMTIGAGDISE